MAARHRSRQRALQVLYQWDMRKQHVEDAIAAVYTELYTEEESPDAPPSDPFMEQLARGVAGSAAALDKRIEHHSQHWRLERMAPVDRNILRLAIFEMGANTPAPIVIDEAIELARQFSGDESVGFINGVLDAVHKESKTKP